MKYLSVCSGVEAASQAWMPLGWEAVAFSEIEPFPCAVLASRFPNVPNLGDMSKIHYNKETKELYNDTTRLVCNGGIDLIVGGTPCQSFSVAGKRAGLEGASGLAYHYARLIGEIQPRWFVWENVPGALSSVTYGDQRDFNFLLQQFAIGGDADLGIRYNLCWRVLDTQYVRVEHFPRAIPQRRRRVFIVGHLATDCGGGCEVLLEPEGVRGNTAPRRVKGKGVTRDIAQGVGGADDAINCAMRGNRSASERGKLIESDFTRCAYTVTGVQTDSMAAVGFDPSPRECLKRQHYELGDTMKNGTNPGHHNAVAISFKGGQSADGGLGVDEGACQTMQSKMSAVEPTIAIRTANGVECLTPYDPQTERIYGTDGASWAQSANSGGGQDRRAICVKTANTKSNGDNVNQSGAAYTIDGANGQAVAYGISTKQQSLATAVEAAPTIGADDYKEPLAIGIGRDAFNSGKNAQMAQSFSTEVQPPIIARGPGGGMHQWRTTNGEDVMPTLDTRLAAQVDKQMERNGSYLCGPIQ